MLLHTVFIFFAIGAAMAVYAVKRYKDPDFNLWKISPVVLVVAGVTITVLSVYSMREIVDQRNRQYFESLVSDSENALYRRFVSYRQSLWGALGVFHASDYVTQREWDAYVKALQIDRYMPGINGIGFIEFVPAGNLDVYEENVRSEGQPDFNIHPKTDAGDKYIVKYIVPLDRNNEALGLDIGSDHALYEAAERARETGTSALSGKIQLVQDMYKRPAFVLFLPYYKDQQQRKDFQGFVFAPFIGEFFLKDIPSFTKGQVDLAVYDGVQVDKNSLIFEGDTYGHGTKPKYQVNSVLDIAGQKWTIQWQTTENFVPRYSDQQVYLVLALGFMLTFFVALILQMLVYRREMVERDVRKRTEELNKTRKRLRLIMDNIPDLIFVKDADAHIVDANPAFLNLYAPEERDRIFGTTTVEKFPEEEASMFLEADWKALEEGFSEYKEYITDYRGHTRMLMTKKVAFEDVDGKRYILAVARDITALDQAQEMLRTSEERFDLAMKAAGIGLWDWDYQTNNFYFNDQFFIMLGYEPNEYPGHFDTIKALVHPDDLEPALENLDRHIEGEKDAFETLLRMKRKSGEWAWVSVHGKVFSWDDKGAPLRIIGTHVDITALKETQQEAEVAKEEAKRASLMKSDFVANMSHELRTPLNGIIGVTELLHKTKLTDKQAGYVDIIYSSGNRLMSLVNDILDFSKIEAGMVRLNEGPTVLKDLVEETVKIHALQAVKKNIELGVGYDPDIPAILMVDGLRIQQVLTNLLGNAIKFTDNGRVLLGVHLKKRMKHSVKIRFKIIDQGIGIPKDKLDDIFQKFLQLDQSISKQHVGTGLGLAITKDLVELMGGKIHVESEPGEGSVFWFDLKLKIVDDVVVQDTGVKQAGGKKKQDVVSDDRIKADVLLVEDEEVNRIVAKEILEQAGCRVDIAQNGKEAIDKIKSGGENGNYDIVFMDCMMPGMDGYQATKEIRLYEHEQEISSHFIVAMTAKAIEGTEEKCLEAGMNDYFPKPIRQKDLQEKLDGWLSEKNKIKRDGKD